MPCDESLINSKGLMMKTIKAILQNDSGATTVEYALLLVLVALFLAAAISAMGVASSTAFDTSANAINDSLK